MNSSGSERSSMRRRNAKKGAKIRNTGDNNTNINAASAVQGSIDLGEVTLPVRPTFQLTDSRIVVVSSASNLKATAQLV